MESLPKQKIITRKGAHKNNMFEKLALSTESLDVSVRLANAIANNGYDRIWKIVLRSESDLLKTKYFSRNLVRELKEILAKDDLELGMRLAKMLQASLKMQERRDPQTIKRQISLRQQELEDLYGWIRERIPRLRQEIKELEALLPT